MLKNKRCNKCGSTMMQLSLWYGSNNKIVWTCSNTRCNNYINMYFGKDKDKHDKRS